MTDFYDTTRPAMIPRGASACLYADGRYRAPRGSAAGLGPTRWITVLGGPAAAGYAGLADFEPFNPVFDDPAALRGWALERKRLGGRARVYTDLDNLPEAMRRTAGLPNVVFWLAWWTEDRQPRDVDDLLEQAALFDVMTLEPDQVWAHQFTAGDAYDTSRLLAAW